MWDILQASISSSSNLGEQIIGKRVVCKRGSTSIIGTVLMIARNSIVIVETDNLTRIRVKSQDIRIVEEN